MRAPAKGSLLVLAGLAAVIAVGAALSVAQIDGTVGGSHFAWFAARAAGILAFLLATASVLFGLATSTRLGDRQVGKGNVVDVHRALSLLTLLAVGGHILFLSLDEYASFGAGELLVPFMSWYRPAWTGLGVLAAYLAAAVFASFYVRSRIGYKAWRVFHYAAFAVFVLATLHGLMAGTDSGAVWVDALYGTAVAAVAAMLAYRVTRRRSTVSAITASKATARGLKGSTARPAGRASHSALAPPRSL